MNGTRRPKKKLVNSRIQPSEENAPLKYIGMSEGILQFLI